MDGLQQAIEVLRRTLVFFVRWYPVVFGVGMLGAIQRFVSVAGRDVSWLDGATGDALTWAARLVFVAWLGWMLVWRDLDGDLAGLDEWITRYIDANAGMLIASGLILMGSFLVLNGGTAAIGRTLVQEEHRSTFTAWELAIKNVTVIPFVMVWLMTIARDALVTSRTQPES